MTSHTFMRLLPRRDDDCTRKTLGFLRVLRVLERSVTSWRISLVKSRVPRAYLGRSSRWSAVAMPLSKSPAVNTLGYKGDLSCISSHDCACRQLTLAAR